MLKRVWEVAALVIVVSMAAHLLLTMVTPLIPLIILGAIVVTILGGLYHRKRRW